MPGRPRERETERERERERERDIYIYKGLEFRVIYTDIHIYIYMCV